MRTQTVLAASCLACLLGACAAPGPQAPTNPQDRGPRLPGAGILFTQAALETPDDETAMRIVVEGDSVALRDGRGRTLATYGITDTRLSITLPDGGAGGAVERSPSAFTITGAAGDPAAALTLSRDPDGDLRVDRGATPLLDIKARDYGYKIVDASGLDLGRVRVGTSRIRVRNAKRELVRETKAPLSTAAVACWVMPHVEPYEATGMLLAITLWGLPD